MLAWPAPLEPVWEEAAGAEVFAGGSLACFVAVSAFVFRQKLGGFVGGNGWLAGWQNLHHA